jgi:hypothetical protein
VLEAELEASDQNGNAETVFVRVGNEMSVWSRRISPLLRDQSRRNWLCLSTPRDENP